jgi:hypothetical protein
MVWFIFKCKIHYYASKNIITFPSKGRRQGYIFFFIDTAPKYKYLTLCLYQLMEVGGGRGIIWGERVTVHL